MTRRRKKINPAKALRLRPTPSDVLRFVIKVTLRQVPGVRLGECWEWVANADDRAYGKFKINGRQEWAHRASYAMFRGPLPDLLEVDHRCHNPRCVNPWHLSKRTKAANVGESNRRRARARRRRRTEEVAPF